MQKEKVLITGNLPEDLIAELVAQFDVKMNPHDRPMGYEELLRAVADREGILTMINDTIDRKLLDRAPRLRMIANFGVGYNNIDVEASTARGIAVSNTPDVLTDTTADLAFALLLSAARGIIQGDRLIREKGFPPWAPFASLGTEVSGKTLGIIGLGRIGAAVARRARGFGMRVVYHSRNRLGPAEERDTGVEFAPLKDLLSLSDFITLHVPLTTETKHLIGAAELGFMKRDSYLINTSRGAVVDEKALLCALEKKEIAGAALDVYENEPTLTPGLTRLDNVVLLPHIGSATRETRTKMARMAVRNLVAGLKGERPPNLVNSGVWPGARPPSP